MTYNGFPIKEEQRQLIILALAHLAVERPGWDDACRETVELFEPGAQMYFDFKDLKRKEKEGRCPV